MRIEGRGRKSIRFTIMCRDEKELRAKLLVEIAKFKLFCLIPEGREVLL